MRRRWQFGRASEGRLVEVIRRVVSDVGFIRSAVELCQRGRLDPTGHARMICKVMHGGVLRLRHHDPYRTMALIKRKLSAAARIKTSSEVDGKRKTNQPVAVRRGLRGQAALSSRGGKGGRRQLTP